MAVDRGLQVDLADPLEDADEEAVDGDRAAGVRCFDMAFAELRREALEQPNLFVGEVAFSRRSRRSCLVNSPWRIRTPRIPPADTYSPLSRSSCSTRRGP